MTEKAIITDNHPDILNKYLGREDRKKYRIHFHEGQIFDSNAQVIDSVPLQGKN